MIVKTFEIRDRATLIPAVAIRFDYKAAEGHARTLQGPDLDAAKRDLYLFHRAGFGPTGGAYTLLTSLVSLETQFDPHRWRDRTMRTAHLSIREHWDALETGAVIDVEYLLGETAVSRRSDR